MIVYRLCKQDYTNDLSGRGAEITGGRWNSKGVAALYTAASRALTVLEVAVHVPFGIIPVNYYMTAIEIPGDIPVNIIAAADLPHNWNSNPLIKPTQYIGDSLLKSKSQLVLQVPSAAVPGEYNYILNPLHTGFKRIKILWAEPFEFDSRLFKK